MMRGRNASGNGVLFRPFGPAVPVVSKLIDVIEKAAVDDWYFLQRECGGRDSAARAEPGPDSFRAAGRGKALERVAQRKTGVAPRLKPLDSTVRERELERVAANV